MTIDPAYQSWENQAVNRGLTPRPFQHISGLELNADISLGDLILNVIEDNGVVWVVTDIDGWWVHPDPDVPDYPRGNADGSYDVRGRWKARELTLSGVFLTPDPDLVPYARERLIQATSLVYRGEWLKVYEDIPKAAFVRLSGRPNIQTVNARGRTEFSIGLRAPDPIKYSWSDEDPSGFDIVTIPCANAATSESGTRTVVNAGNTAVACYMEITGPTIGQSTITNTTTGDTLLILEPIGDGLVMELDTYDNSVIYDGESAGARAMLDPLLDWIKLQPGDNVITFEDAGEPDSTAILRMYYRSGWIG